MKRALVAIASMAIMATAVGVEAANAQYAPTPPAYTAPPAYGPAPSYSARRYPPTPYGGPRFGHSPTTPPFRCPRVRGGPGWLCPAAFCPAAQEPGRIHDGPAHGTTTLVISRPPCLFSRQ